MLKNPNIRIKSEFLAALLHLLIHSINRLPSAQSMILETRYFPCQDSDRVKIIIIMSVICCACMTMLCVCLCAHIIRCVRDCHNECVYLQHRSSLYMHCVYTCVVCKLVCVCIYI